MTEDAAGSLFEVAELVEAAPERMGQAEAGLWRAIRAGDEAGTLLPEDAGMIGAALVSARALDHADRNPNSKTGYLIAALTSPHREVLQALRLPAALAPSDPRAPKSSQSDEPDWLRDAFGTPSD
jgi:hypothetical protein